NWSAVVVALVPPGVVTVTSTVPTGSTGAAAVIEVSELTMTELAGAEPKVTALAPVRLVPVMVTEVPPVVRPEVGERPVTVGAGGSENENWSAVVVALVPPGVVTVTSTVPTGSTGAAAVIEVSELTMNELAGAEPKVTALAPVRSVPVIVTEVPPTV